MEHIKTPKFISPTFFKDYTYSKKRHFDLFKENKYDEELFGRDIDPDYCDLKVYQDMLMLAYVKQNILPGSKMLDVGGGASRILKYFANEMECWNIDKLEGVGNGPVDDQFDREGYRLVSDYMGNFNKELPNDYFDIVFSISTLEHVPLDDYESYANILKDINRVLKPGGYSVHCIDVVWIKPDTVWTNEIMPYFYKNEKLINEFIPFNKVIEDQDLYHMTEKYYSENWQNTTGKPFQEFGTPFSYNFLWRKPEIISNEISEVEIKNTEIEIPQQKDASPDLNSTDLNSVESANIV